MKLPIFIVCSIELAEIPTEIHVAPLGKYKGHPQGEFEVTPADIETMIRNFKSLKNDVVIDYEHQTLNSSDNGRPAPAAGWVKDMQARDNGLWGTTLEWTKNAQDAIANKEYKYLSPVFMLHAPDPKTGKDMGFYLHSVALTNTPFFRGDLEALWNSIQITDNQQQEESNVNLEQALAEIARLKRELATLQAKDTDSTGKIKALEAQIQTLQAKVDEVTVAAKETEAETVVAKAIEDKKLLPAQKEWAKKLCMSDRPAFDSFMTTMSPVDITKGVHIEGKDNPGGLTFAKLMEDPDAMEKCKKETPELFAKLHQAHVANPTGGK